jgi:L-rhamnonate dehydratase
METALDTAGITHVVPDRGVMRITNVECTVLRLPEVRLVADGSQDTLLVRIHTDAGLIGIGEGHTSPWVLKAIIEAPPSHVCAQGLRDLLVGEDPFQVERLWDKLYHHSAVYGRRGAVIHAISALDIALWDLIGKATGQPVWRLLGGGYRREVPAYASTLMPEEARLAADEARRWRDEGFRAVKLGWGALGADVKRDLQVLAGVREAVGPQMDLLVDVGYGVDFATAVALARGLEAIDAYLLEEPLSPDDLDGYARLADAVNLPIASGEKETTRWGFRDLIQRGRVDVIQPDVARAGGFTECRRIAHLAALHNVTVLPHCWSTDVLVAATLHYIAALPRCPYLEYCVVDSPLRRCLVRDPIGVCEGLVRVPDGPGLGVEINEDTVARYRYG